MWHVQETVAEWIGAPWRLQLNIAQPGNGLQWTDQDGVTFDPGAVFQTDLGPETATDSDVLPDWYTRGQDLIVTYPATDRTPIQTQIDWRILDLTAVPGAVAFDVVISRQTDLLDSRPAIEVTSSPAGKDWFRLEPDTDQPETSSLVRCHPGTMQIDQLPDCCAFLLRLPNRPMTFAQLMQTVDLQKLDLQVEDDDQATALKTVLFRERLEKGVVRRARVRGMLLPRECDQSVAWQYAQQLRQAIPPLTV